MKKTIILAAVACVALASCVKNERIADSPTTGDVQISFNALTHKATKADEGSITGATYPVDEKFDVWAVFSQNNLAFTDLATASNYSDFIGAGGGAGAAFASAGTATDGIYWKGDGTAYYWPRAGKLSFVAFSPASVDPTYTWTTKTFAKAGYTVSQSKDLMYSDITPNKTRNDYTVNNPVLPYDDNPAAGDTDFDDYKGVNILFHHAQSLVQFKVIKENTAPNETITVTDISLVNPYTTADLAVTYSGFNAATAAWSNHTDETANVVFTTGQTVVVPTVPGPAVNVPASAGDPASGTTTNDFIVLPQPLNHTAPNKVQVAVTFTSTVGSVTSSPTTLNINLSDGQISAAGDHTEWAPNKRYIYTIKFVGTEIILDPKVVVYDTDVNVTLPDLAAY